MLEVHLPELVCVSKYAGFQGTVFLHFSARVKKTKDSVYLLKNVLTSVPLHESQGRAM